VHQQLATWHAWYAGDTDQLATIYGGDPAGPGHEFFASESGGFKRGVKRAATTVRRWFWGNRNTTGQPRNRLHTPLAGDIAATSADLLFSEPPTVTVDVDEDSAEPTQQRLDQLLDDGAQATLLEAAELAAAHGGVYLRTMWDTTLRDQPWLSAVHADTAVPEWLQGRLVAVTFWRIVRAQGKIRWRHLERHEPGQILHGLYQGDQDELGQPVPLSDLPELAGLAAAVNTEQAIPTGHTGLTAVYIPNMRPNKIWRGSSTAPLGRSDYAGVEPLMDALDLTWSGWMRDVDLGKARLVVPQAYLQTHGPGKGATFELDQEVYEPVQTLGGDEASKLSIEQVQFKIRVDEHSRTVEALKAQIVGSAGYSPQTFGLLGEVAVTATEVAARERRSLITRDRKIRYWRPALVDILYALLAVDITIFASPGVVVLRPHVEFPAAVSVDPEAQARTLQALDTAGAISIDQKVRQLHPDWLADEINAEVNRIMGETGRRVEDPDVFRGAGAGGAS
jgi:A118 family predicted phage portal protein